jgi:hypothetical protein
MKLLAMPATKPAAATELWLPQVLLCRLLLPTNA